MVADWLQGLRQENLTYQEILSLCLLKCGVSGLTSVEDEGRYLCCWRGHRRACVLLLSANYDDKIIWLCFVSQ